MTRLTSHVSSPLLHRSARRNGRSLACRAAGLALLALALGPATASADHAHGPWDGRWTLSLQQPGGVQNLVMQVRGAGVTQTSERLTANSIATGNGWSMEIEILPGQTVGLAGISAVDRQGQRMICAARVDRGVFTGTCYAGQGEEIRFSLAPKHLLAAQGAPAPQGPAQGPPQGPPQAVPTVPMQPAPAQPAPPVVVVEQAPPPSCNDTLLAKGHHPMHLKNCKGVEPYCAVALLQAGHHPMHLKHCRFDIEPTCAQTLIARGHAPMHLNNCVGVNPQCAVGVLDKGHHPMHLKNCR